MLKKISVFAVVAVFIALLVLPSSCKWFKKEEKPVAVDSITTAAPTTPVNTINLPHADSSLIPVLTKILDEAFEASAKKDYAKLASLLVYHGPDPTRYGQAVFNIQSTHDKKVVTVTGEVFNKWNRNVEMRECARIFSLPQPDGTELPVLEVLLISKKTLDRKFFIFLSLGGSYKILEVTSRLQ
jgi:hypothetical protein